LYQHKDRAIKEHAALWQCLLPAEPDIEQQRQIDIANANLAHVRAGDTAKYTIKENIAPRCDYQFVSDSGYEPFIDSTHYEVTLPVVSTQTRLTNLDHRHIQMVDVADVLQTDHATLANNANYLVDGDSAHVFTVMPTRAYDDETSNYVDLQITMTLRAIADPFNTLQLHSLLIGLEGSSGAYADLLDEQDNPLVSSDESVFAQTSIFHLKEYSGLQSIRLTLRQYRFIPVLKDGVFVKAFPFIIGNIALLQRQYVTRTDSNAIAHIILKMPLHAESLNVVAPVISPIRHPDVSAPGLQPCIFTLLSNAQDRSQTPAPFGSANDVDSVYVRCDMAFNTTDPSYTYRPVLRGVEVEYEVT